MMLRIGGIASPTGVLTLLAIALSAVALYYYLIVLKQALVEPSAPARSARIRVPAAAAITLLAAAALTIVLGLFPSLLLGLF
jgi:NADH-quinone oxidoreductase subunit N